MNETIRTLVARRSCRSFKPDQIDETLLRQVLEAGTYAPTGMGRQSPVIVVLQDKADVARLSRMNAAVMGAAGDPFYGAPTVLVVLADKACCTYCEDASLVIGNMLNAAHALGLGGCWIHRAKEEFETEEGQRLLKQWGIDGDYAGVGHCILGYPEGETRPALPRKKGYIVRV